MRRRNGFNLPLADRLELEKRQREYQALCVDFAGEVINVLGGVEGSARAQRRAVHDLAGTVADAVAAFVINHTDWEG